MKKIKNLAIIILMTTFLIILGTKVEATTGTINSETVRVRKEPNTKSTILDQLDKGDEVEILEQEDDWYKVKVKTEQGTITGYISETLVDVEESSTAKNQGNTKEQETEEDETEVGIQAEPIVETPVEVPSDSQENDETIITDIPVDEVIVETTSNIEENNEYTLEQEASIKALPLINSIEIGKISGNVKIIETINDWSRIENDNGCGWIRTNILKQSLTNIETPTEEEQPTEITPEETIIIDPEPTTTTTEPEETTTEVNKTGYVSAEGLIVRKEPTTDSEELDSLAKNDKVEIIGQTGNWYKINWNGETGYVSAKYISDTKLPETTSRSGSSLKNATSTGQNEETETEEVEEATKEDNPSVSETSGTTGAAVVEYAKQYLGYKYVSGGASPETGFDCSGFTSYVYKHFRISLNRTSKDQIKNGVAVEKSDLQLGDIVIFNNDANTAIGHVGIYVGDGNFIHASNPSDGVKITTLTTGYYQKRYVGARRVI